MTIYVNSNASGLDDGSSQANAFATLQQGLDHANALTDNIFMHVGTTPHNEAANGFTFTSAQADSKTAILNIYGVDFGNSEAFVSVRDGAHGGLNIDNTGTGDLTFSVNAAWHGIEFDSVDDTFINTSNITSSFHGCKFTAGTASGDDMTVGENNSSVLLVDCIIIVGDQISFNGIVEFRGCTITTGISPNFKGSASHHYTKFSACDVSGITSGDTIFDISGLGSGSYFFYDTDMPASWTGISGTWDNYAQEVLFANCDDSSEYYRTEYYCKSGDVKTDTAVNITTSGWSDETGAASGTALSHIMTPTSLINFGHPLPGFAIPAYLDSTGSKTFTVELIDDFENALQDDEVWLEILYKATSGQVAQTIASTRVLLGSTVANLAAGTGTGNWTGEPTSSRSVKLATTVTIGNVGNYEARVYLAKYEANGADGNPGAALYVAPLLTIS